MEAAGSRTTRSRARTDPALLAGYKTPLFVNGNIHGNEKEGTDAILRVIEQWATSTDPAVETLLQRNRLVFNVTSNPDGRVANTRANARGLRPQPRPDDRARSRRRG